MVTASTVGTDFLFASPLFNGLGADEINRLVELAEIQEYGGGGYRGR